MDLPLFNVNILFGLKQYVRLRIALNPGPCSLSPMDKPYDMILMDLLRKLVWTNIGSDCASNGSNPQDKNDSDGDMCY